jgi:two-component system, LuxR family, response regulator FixJ
MPTTTHDREEPPIVYIVDNDEGTCRALTALLAAGGYRTVAFSQPTPFLAVCEDHRPACVLLDVDIQGMSGLEVQQELNRSGAVFPVIVMTGSAAPHTEAQAMRNGASYFLRKPFQAAELFQRLKLAICGGRVPNAPA